MPNINIELDKDLHYRVRMAAFAAKQSMKDYVATALDWYTREFRDPTIAKAHVELGKSFQEQSGELVEQDPPEPGDALGVIEAREPGQEG